MLSTKQRIIRWFYRQAFPEGELHFDDLLRQGAEDALGKDPIAAAAFSTANSPAYWNYLSEESRIDTEKGLRPLFTITDPSGRKGVWVPRISGLYYGTVGFRNQKACKNRPLIVREIDLIDDRQYEALGCFICSLMGSDRIHLTPPGNENGVDFVSTIISPSKTHLFGREHSPLRIIGQSKKYNTPVSIDKIREFISTLNDVKCKNPRMTPNIPPWFYSTTGPIIGWIVGHTGFQSGAVTYANEHGIILSTSIDFAEIISNSKKFDQHSSITSISRALITEVDNILSRF